MGTVEKDVLLILYVIDKSQVGEVMWVWARMLKWATQQITWWGRSRNMYLGKMYGKCVTRALFVGRAHHGW